VCLGDFLELALHKLRSRIENCDQVSWLLLEHVILCHLTELLVALLGPVRDLIVDDVDSFEAFRQLLLLLVDFTELTVEHDYVRVVFN